MDYVRSGCFNGLVCLVCFFRQGGLFHLPVLFGGMWEVKLTIIAR